MKVQNNISRESYIDVARGLVILLVLIGHSEPPALIKTGIYGFHMPFFFILSGYLFDSNKWCRGIKQFLRTRWKAYIIPYFILSFINLIINIPVEIVNGICGKQLLVSSLKHIFWIAYSYGDASKTPNCTPLWFLPCLFVA